MAKKKSEVVNVIIKNEKDIVKSTSYAKILIILNERDDSPEISMSNKQWGHIKDKINHDGMPFITNLNSKIYIYEEAYWDNFGLMKQEDYDARNKVYQVIRWMRDNFECGNFFYVNIEESHKEK